MNFNDVVANKDACSCICAVSGVVLTQSVCPMDLLALLGSSSVQAVVARKAVGTQMARRQFGWLENGRFAT